MLLLAFYAWKYGCKRRSRSTKRRDDGPFPGDHLLKARPPGDNDLSKVSSFTYYFGRADPTRADEFERLFSEFDVVVLDPTDMDAQFVVERIPSRRARLLAAFTISGEALPSNLSSIFAAVASILNDSIYSGIVFLGMERFSRDMMVIVSSIIKYIRSRNYLVFLEFHAPFCDDSDCIAELLALSNLVILRNVTLNSRGLTNDFFDIPEGFWALVKEANKNMAMRYDFTLVILELADSPPSSAQVSRLNKISQFYRAVPVILSSSAVSEVSENRLQVSPASVIDLMSSPLYQKCQATWKSHLRHFTLEGTSDVTHEEMALLNLLQIGDVKMEEVKCQSVADVLSMKGDPEGNWSSLVDSLLPQSDNSLLGGQKFLLSHPTEEDIVKIRGVQKDLRQRGLLRPFPRDELLAAEKDLLKGLQQVSSQDQSRALQKLLSYLKADGSLQIWSCLHTGLCLREEYSSTSTNVQVWCVWEVETNATKDIVHVYVSRDHPRPSEALLHAFLSIFERLSYVQATESEIILCEQSSSLPARIEWELQNATPTESLLLLHWATSAPHLVIKERILLRVKNTLLFESPSDQELLDGDRTTFVVDWIAYSVFRAFKKEAYEELRLRVNDFNPLPFRDLDQEAVISELYTLGSRCVEFFDLGIHDLSGMLLADRLVYLQSRNPPASKYNSRKLMFMYRPLIHCGNTDISSKGSHIRIMRGIGASLIFAIPALIDIFLLLLTGFGLFVNTRMSLSEQRYLTWALLFSLVSAGLFNPAISICGTYYFARYQFPAMESIMIRSYVGALLATWLTAAIICVVIFLRISVYGAALFFFYSLMYPVYFIILHAAFWSILALVSVFMFTSYLRRLGNWMSEIVHTDSKSINAWYSQKYGAVRNPSKDQKDSYFSEIARAQAEKEVVSESSSFRFILGCTNPDPFVEKLAKSAGMTSLLMQWHSRFLNYDIPPMFGMEWNLNVKLAYQEMQKLNKGGLIHRSRMFWNTCKWEMLYGFCFFFLLLLDRWIVLFSGGDVLGLITIKNRQSGLGQGGAMLHFLICCVFVEILSREVWQRIQNQQLKRDIVKPGEINDKLRLRQRATFGIYAKFGLLLFAACVLALVPIAVFVWIFTAGWRSVVTFGAYTFAYMALTWIAFMKSFFPSNSPAPAIVLLFGLIAGFLVGIPVHVLKLRFGVNLGIIAASLWVPACVLYAIFRWRMKGLYSGKVTEEAGESYVNRVVSGQHCISGKHVPLTELELEHLCEQLRPGSTRLDPFSSLGYLLQKNIKDARKQFDADLQKAMDFIVESWGKPKKFQIYLFSDDALDASFYARDFRGLHMWTEGEEGRCLILFVSTPSKVSGENMGQPLDDPPSLQALCETIIHEVCEGLGMRHIDAVRAEMSFSPINLSIPMAHGGESRAVSVPVRVLKEIENLSMAKLQGLMIQTRLELIKSLCFAWNPDLEWHRTTRSVRAMIVKRLLGEEISGEIEELVDYLASCLNVEPRTLVATAHHTVSLSLAVGFLSRSRSQLLNRDRRSTSHLSQPDRRMESNAEKQQIQGTIAEQPKHWLASHLNRAGELLFGVMLGDSQLPRHVVISGKNTAKAWRWIITRKGDDLLLSLRSAGDRVVRRVWTDTYVQKVYCPLSPETAFLASRSADGIIYNHYRGVLSKCPSSKRQIIAVSKFTENLRLQEKESLKNGRVTSTTLYVYSTSRGHQETQVPVKKELYDANGLKKATYFYTAMKVTHAEIAIPGISVYALYSYRKENCDDVSKVIYYAPHCRLKVTLEFFIIFNSRGKTIYVASSTIVRSICEELTEDEFRRFMKKHRFAPHQDLSPHPTIGGVIVTAWSPSGSDIVPDSKHHRDLRSLQDNPSKGRDVATPDPLLHLFHSGLLEYPSEARGFLSENPLFHHGQARSETTGLDVVKRFFGVPVSDSHASSEKRCELVTSQARTALWRKWLESTEIPGVWGRMLDEELLRKDEVMKEYWSYRDCGDHKSARAFLKNNESMVRALLAMEKTVSSKCHLAIRFEDLVLMGVGGEANTYTLNGKTIDIVTQPGRDLEATPSSVSKRPLRALGLATGTWPSSSGGVSNCVRDLVDNLDSVEWMVLAENAHELELILPQFQIQKHVESLVMLPLWGFDGLEAMHAFSGKLFFVTPDFTHLRQTADVIEGTLPDSILAERRQHTTPQAIDRFLAILRRLVSACTGHQTSSDGFERSVYRKSELHAATNVFVEYYEFFQTHDYNEIWEHPRVSQAWIELWMAQRGYLPTNSLELEYPSLDDLFEAKNYVKRTLFCLTVKLPIPFPDVIQTTHHAIGSVYAIVAKQLTGKFLIAWDHGILWREYLAHWSASESTYSPGKHSLLLSLARLVSTLTLFHADAIVPCTRISNPEWETWRVSSGGAAFHALDWDGRKKIDPIVNGIVDLECFYPDRSAEYAEPDRFLVCMLSHIVTFKDIKNAILAANVIVNQFGIKGYQLDIYGSTDKVPWYTNECNVLIQVCGLEDNVRLKGYGDSQHVLNSAWLILNSSIAEGLPLALGEAGLCGIPIVCTEAGGSREVIQVSVPTQTGSEHPTSLGRCVSPSSPYDLAVAQLAVLGMFDDLEAYVRKTPLPGPEGEGRGHRVDSGAALGLELEPSGAAEPTPSIREWISQGLFTRISERILSKRRERQGLGDHLRQHVLKSFSGQR
ncbi:hypothetical protein HDU96_010891 [Phlyctochytrium bullatum]|nr:hypothetical protein HDU96_010891 [Phlyctochytrium bullatum]